MASDGDFGYGTYTGAQLLEAFDTIDRARFPKNYQALREELMRRPAPGPTMIDGGEVVELVALPRVDRRKLIRACVTKLFLLNLWGAIGGGLAGGFVAILLSIVVSLFGVSWVLWLTTSLIVAGAVALQFGTYWAYTKLLLQDPIGRYTFRLVRIRAYDT